jgi:hypothetical protein
LYQGERQHCPERSSAANDDAVYVATQHRAVPNAGFFFERDVSNDGGPGHNPGAGMDRGTFFETRGDTCVPSGQRIRFDMHRVPCSMFGVALQLMEFDYADTRGVAFSPLPVAMGRGQR